MVAAGVLLTPIARHFRLVHCRGCHREWLLSCDFLPLVDGKLEPAVELELTGKGWLKDKMCLILKMVSEVKYDQRNMKFEINILYDQSLEGPSLVLTEFIDVY